MKFQENYFTPGEQMIKELSEYLKRRRNDTAGYLVFGDKHKRQLDHQWACEFFKERGIIDSAIRKVAGGCKPNGIEKIESETMDIKPE